MQLLLAKDFISQNPFRWIMMATNTERSSLASSKFGINVEALEKQRIEDVVKKVADHTLSLHAPNQRLKDPIIQKISSLI